VLQRASDALAVLLPEVGGLGERRDDALEDGLLVAQLTHALVW